MKRTSVWLPPVCLRHGMVFLAFTTVALVQSVLKRWLIRDAYKERKCSSVGSGYWHCKHSGCYATLITIWFHFCTLELLLCYAYIHWGGRCALAGSPQCIGKPARLCTAQTSTQPIQHLSHYLAQGTPNPALESARPWIDDTLHRTELIKQDNN